MPFISPNYKFEYFRRGSDYSGQSDFQRFVTLDYNLESYIGVVGIGIIDGWELSQTSGLEIQITPGNGVINGYFAESPYSIKKRSELVSGEREVTVVKINQSEEPELTELEEDAYIAIVQEYNPSFNPTPPIINEYIKVSTPYTITLSNNADTYIWVERKFTNFYPQMSDYPAYLLTEPLLVNYKLYDDYLEARTAYNAQMDIIKAYDWKDNADNHFTEVEFKTGSSFSASPEKVLLGLVATRNNEVSTINVKNVKTIKEFEETIKKYANKVIAKHTHGGSEPFDPSRINLETDVRRCVLTSYNPETRRGVFSVVESQLTGVSDGHRHTFTIDADGNGQTVGIIGNSVNHFHKIENYTVLNQGYTIESISDHSHDLPNIDNFVWNDSSEYIVYVNGIEVGDNESTNITVDPSGKRLILEGIIGGITKTFSVNFDVGDKNYSFSSQASSVYKFMLEMITDFNLNFPVIDINENPFVFYDETTQSIAGIEDLKAQSITAEALLQNTGDKFVFTPNAARQIEIVLSDYQKTKGLESDYVTIEILGNSEVFGILKEENIFFVNAQKIATGVFELARIPFLSHSGRIDENIIPFKYPLVSRNGSKFSVVPSITDVQLGHYHSVIVDDFNTGLTSNTYISDDPIYYVDTANGEYLIAHTHGITKGKVDEIESEGLLDWQNDVGNTIESSKHDHNIIYPIIGDAKVIYSISEDQYGDIYIGTSDGLISIPNDLSYLFVINEIQIYEIGDNLLSMFENAKKKYELLTETPLKISSDVYIEQLDLAEDYLVYHGDSFFVIGKTDSFGNVDKTMIQKCDFFNVPNYKSSSVKTFEEIGKNDIITKVQLRDVETGALLDPDNENVKEQISDDPDSVEYVAITNVFFKDIPVTSIHHREIEKNTITNNNIFTVGGNFIATNKNIRNDFYFDWSSPTTPFSVSIYNGSGVDEDGSLWVASNNGVYVLRSHNQGSIISSTKRPGNSPYITDILVLDSNNVWCASDGIYKSENQGKSWSKKLSGAYLQIIQDIKLVSVVIESGHTHVISVNKSGNGILEESSGHTHEVINWVVQESDSHIHELNLTLYAVSTSNVYKSIDNGETWSLYATILESDFGKLFAYNDVLYIPTSSGIYKYDDEWVKISDIIAYSFNESYDLDSFYVGSYNNLYNSTDGETFSSVYSFTGYPLPSLVISSVKKYFGYSYSNKQQCFYINNVQMQEDSVSFIGFGKWEADNGGWDESSKYDIYINQKLILSTKENIDNRETSGFNFTVDNTSGIIDFSSEANVISDIAVFDSFVEVDSVNGFSIGDRILIKSVKEVEQVESEDPEVLTEYYQKKMKYDSMYFYTTITEIGENHILFSPKITLPITDKAKVYKISNLDANSSIIINIYKSSLKNTGAKTHKELEDKLSYKTNLRPYNFNNSYLSNILQLTQAVRYVYPNIDSTMMNTKFYDFHYSSNPLDDNYVGNYIDLPNSESYSLINYESNFSSLKSSSINKILIGTGSFLNKIIVATDIGVFWAESTDAVNANWFYSFGLNLAVYDLKIFGNENLLVATENGIYKTQDMITWTYENSEGVRFPSFSMSLRWPENSYVNIASHSAELYNNDADPQLGVIKSSSNLYLSLKENRAIKISVVGDDENVKNGNYIVKSVSKNKILVSPKFEGDTETLTITMTMGSWWQQFDGEDNEGNIDLTNTLLVGGKNKIAYTPFFDQFVWTSSQFDTGIKDVNVVSFLPLSTGGILASAVGINKDNVLNHILRSSDIGKKWSSFKSFGEIRGSISSFSLTEFQHLKLNVNYTYPENLKYSDAEFDKRKITIFSEDGSIVGSGEIINNNALSSSIIIYGSSLYEVMKKNTSYSFEIYPVTINDMVETDDGKILFGTDIGIFEDSYTTLSQYPIYGNIWSIGYTGRVSGIDVSGTIKSIDVNPINNYVIVSVASTDAIYKNEFSGYKMYITDFSVSTPYTISYHSSKGIGGEVVIELENEFSDVWLTYVGKKVKFVKDNSVIKVDFNQIIKNNQLSGGKLYVTSGENNNTGLSYNIVSNTTGSITVDKGIVPKSTLIFNDGNNEIIDGQSFNSFDSSGKINLNVTFSQPVLNNYLSNFSFKITDPNGSMYGAESMIVDSNSGNTIILNSYEDDLPDNVILGLSIKQNESFKVFGPIYQPLFSFNNKYTSTSDGHYHSIKLIGEFITGTIDSIVSSNSSSITFSVNNTVNFDKDIVQEDGTLFKGGTIRFYNPLEIGVEYFSEIISHTGSTITVKILSSTNWDLLTYSNIKISSTWKWEINATNYGYTDDIYYNDFVTLSSIVTKNIDIGDQYVKVTDSTGMQNGDKILIISSINKSEINYIDSVIDENTIQLENVASNSFFISNVVQIKVLRDDFTNIHKHMIRNNEVESLNIDEYVEKGYNSSHSHMNLALIDVISDIKKENNVIYVSGSGSFLYNSKNNGKSWNEVVNLNNFVEDNIEIEGVVAIESRNGQIVAGTSNGHIFSSGDNNISILPLNQPEVS